VAYRRERRWIRDSTDERRARLATIGDEVKRLVADERDQEEMRVIRDQLAELAPARSVQRNKSA
jgi:hypothetical protein